jgi:hypothetical protein
MYGSREIENPIIFHQVLGVLMVILIAGEALSIKAENP